MGHVKRFPPRQKEPGLLPWRIPFWLPLVMMLGLVVGAWAVIEFGGPVQQRPGTSTTVRETFPICDSIWLANCVIDGGTIRWRGESIRIEDINTPEVRKFKCPAEKRLGDRATRRMAQLINLGPFEIVHDGGRDKDKYDRKLRLLVRSGKSLGVILVEEGLAHRWEGYKRSWCW